MQPAPVTGLQVPPDVPVVEPVLVVVVVVAVVAVVVVLDVVVVGQGSGEQVPGPSFIPL